MIELMKLPYARDALEPALTKETIDYHYGKHHKGYVDNLNKLIKGTTYEDSSLEEIINSVTEGPIFNNAAQIYNHNMYWNSLRPEEPVGSDMSKEVEEKINKYFDSLDNLQTTIKQVGTKHFGSGWVWVCEHEDNSLFVHDTHDAETPIIDPLVTPLLVIDVWEHGYYLQYKNDRGAYFDAIWSVMDWNKLVKTARFG